MALKFIKEADFKGKNILARFDFNVPLDKNNPGVITDTSRIDLSLPTIREILAQGPKHLIMMSHLGRPKGKPNSKESLEPIATYLAKVLEEEVLLSESPSSSGVKSMLQLPGHRLILLENLRFHPGEEANDKGFAQDLAQLGDFYVNDAFGAAHRKHASVHQIVSSFKNKAYAGNLLKKEVESLQKLLNKPPKPFVGIIGGAKIADKIKTIEKLLISVDQLLIGGAMAYPFLKSQGFEIGKSLCDEHDVELAKGILKIDSGKKIKLPLDHIQALSIQDSPQNSIDQNIDPKMMGLDIGPKTLQFFAPFIQNAKTLFWNGPMGLFEKPQFAEGTFSLARFISQSKAFSVVGGGDSVSAIKQSGLEDSFSHISTGGGASLEFIERGELPGVQVLKFGLEA